MKREKKPDLSTFPLTPTEQKIEAALKELEKELGLTGYFKAKIRAAFRARFCKYRERESTPAALEAKRIKLMEKIEAYYNNTPVGFSDGAGDLTQLERVLFMLYWGYINSILYNAFAALPSGYVSAAVFLEHYIKAYAQRVYDLRELGFKIDSERCNDKPYDHYRLMAWEKPAQRALEV